MLLGGLQQCAVAHAQATAKGRSSSTTGRTTLSSIHTKNALTALTLALSATVATDQRQATRGGQMIRGTTIQETLESTFTGELIRPGDPG